MAPYRVSLMKWKILDTGPSSAQKNMEIDTKLLFGLKENQEPILHLYTFIDEAATYGHFIKPFAYLKEERVKKRGLQLAKRPTGGGIIFHLWDFTFSLLIPSSHQAYTQNPLENYSLVNALVGKVLTKLSSKGVALLTKKTDTSSFCMANPTIYDILIEGRKIGGAAQRNTKFGFLHQGSIAMAPPSEEFLADVLKDGQVIQEMRENSTYLAAGKQELKTLLTEEIICMN
jgi:lipoate---protein ligase